MLVQTFLLNNIILCCTLSLADIDECTDYPDACTPTELARCDNAVGGYTCSCIEGYQLSTDLITCVGKTLSINLYNFKRKFLHYNIL